MSFRVPNLIKKKRDKTPLKKEEIQFLISSYTEGIIPDYQMSALLMAIYFNGLDEVELAAWTDAMLYSGDLMIHEKVLSVKVDKHSTGGVGDKISIPLAPLVAACGVPVPMISGRGLGHTGGTLDKLESIPGFNVNLEPQESSRLLEELGLFFVGQTKKIAPADKKLYALRDVTATVESIPLIASSIMSKKIAEGIDALVLDVKCGSGAFMKDLNQALDLAKTIKDIGQRAGKKVHALITDMNSPIGKTVGNALEIKESIEVLKGKGNIDTLDLTVELGSHMLLLGKAVSSLEEGKKKILDSVSKGTALELFSKIIKKQGGDPRICDNLKLLPQSKHIEEIKALSSGYISKILPEKIAQAALSVCAGRNKKEDNIDPSTGIELICTQGDYVNKGETIALLHHNETGKDQARHLIEEAFLQGEKPISLKTRIIQKII